MLKLGLVFAGGGGKGAYQIGVWKALRETGLDVYVSAVAGTSVGGLNAALFLQGDYEKAEFVWKNISPRQILSPHTVVGEAAGKIKKYGWGFFTRDGLEEIIEKSLDMAVFDQSDKNCYLSCYKIKEKYVQQVGSYTADGDLTYQNQWDQENFVHNGILEEQAVYFNMREFSYEERMRLLLATSAIPFIFPKEKVRNMYLVDGSVKDNVPIEPLCSLEGCNMILAVHLKRDSDFIDSDRFPNTHILEIVPQDDLGGVFNGVLDFKPEHARKRILQGYQETMPLFSDIKKYLTMFSQGEEKIAKRIMYSKILQWQNREHQNYRIRTNDG